MNSNINNNFNSVDNSLENNEDMAYNTPVYS